MNYKFWVSSYELLFTSWKFKYELKFKSASSNAQVSSLNPRVTSLNLQVQDSFNKWKLK